MRIVACLCAVLVGLQSPSPRPAVPLDPVSAIVDAFRTHSVVAVMAGHGEVRGYAFLQLLIHDPRLISAINDIVIEEASARYQESPIVSCGARACRSSRCGTRGAIRHSRASAKTASGRSSLR
jgi:hypothetical protein